MISVGTSSEADAMFRTIMEANLSSEVALIVLDVVSLFTQNFKVGHVMRENHVPLPEHRNTCFLLPGGHFRLTVCSARVAQ